MHVSIYIIPIYTYIYLYIYTNTHTVEKSGIKCETLSLANFGDLRGVMAKTPIKIGATMLTYPRTAIMDLVLVCLCVCVCVCVCECVCVCVCV